ncbi:MAG: nucleotide exchange factor GrpE [Nitrosopumilaceae archaeon]
MSDLDQHKNKSNNSNETLNGDDDGIVNEEIENLNESNELVISNLKNELELSKKNLAEYEEKLKHSLADFQNLQRKTQSDIEKGINLKIDKLFLNFLTIYDDLILAKKVLADGKIDVSGLESIIKNMNALLLEYKVTPINALGEIFNPNFHEAVSIVEDPSLDEGTITKEIRKGYISGNRVIRPTIVEISKKIKLDNKNGE